MRRLDDWMANAQTITGRAVPCYIGSLIVFHYVNADIGTMAVYLLFSGAPLLGAGLLVARRSRRGAKHTGITAAAKCTKTRVSNG